MKLRWLNALGFALGLSFCAQAQEAADAERAKASFSAGATAYGAGEYLAAIQAFEAAYAVTPFPQFAFSLAQAERRQYFVDRDPEHLTRAIELFRRYVDEVPHGGRRADALDALSQLEPLAAMRAGAGAAAVPESRAERHTRLMITSEAPAASLSLDSGPPVPSPLIREVAPGTHTVVVSAAGFYSAQLELTAIEGELIPVAVPLRERPSTLVVLTRKDADVWVDGTFIGKAGERLQLDLKSGNHRVTVARKGHRVWSRALRLERGQSRDLRVALPPTAQRVASSAFFIGGAAALSSGLLLSALAIRAENRAEDFLGRRTYGNVSAAQLSTYDSAVEDRNRFRLAAGVCWSASLGLLITGLVLHELDNPAPQSLYRAADPGESAVIAPRRLGHWQLAISPEFGRGHGVEALLGTRF